MPQQPLILVLLMSAVFGVLQSSQSDRTALPCGGGGLTSAELKPLHPCSLPFESVFGRAVPVVRINLTALSSSRLRDALSIVESVATPLQASVSHDRCPCAHPLLTGHGCTAMVRYSAFYARIAPLQG